MAFQKLELGPNDVLVVRARRALTQEQLSELEDIVRATVPPGSRVLIMDTDTEVLAILNRPEPV